MFIPDSRVASKMVTLLYQLRALVFDLTHFRGFIFLGRIEVKKNCFQDFLFFKNPIAMLAKLIQVLSKLLQQQMSCFFCGQ